MPHGKTAAPDNARILRFRCYACSEPCWDLLTNIELPDYLNTVTVLCDPCTERFDKEGQFWPKVWKEVK